MYGLFTHTWLIFLVNVGKYTIHGFYGYGKLGFFPPEKKKFFSSPRGPSPEKCHSRCPFLGGKTKKHGQASGKMFAPFFFFHGGVFLRKNGGGGGGG